MSEKLSSDELSNSIVQSLALSNALIERFEIMIDNNVFAQRSKQSVKNTIIHLTAYINKVFNPAIQDDAELKLWSDIVLNLQTKVDNALSDEEIVIITDRKALLRKVLEDNIHLANHEIIDEIMKKVWELEILKF